MQITKEMLRDWGACHSGTKWFLSRFPDGNGEYQDVLNALADDDRPSDAEWLMNKAGPDKGSVLELDVVSDRKHLFVAGYLKVSGLIEISGYLMAGSGIEAGENIRAGSGIEAGENIRAGSGIEAGWGIRAGSGIEAGEGIRAGSEYGIFAGLRVKISKWHISARVAAKSKPENLISGMWSPVSEKQDAA